MTQEDKPTLILNAENIVHSYTNVLMSVYTNLGNVKMSVMNETIKAVESIVEHGGESYTYKLTTLKKNFKFQ